MGGHARSSRARELPRRNFSLFGLLDAGSQLGRPSGRPKRRLRLEALEDRRLMAVDLAANHALEMPVLPQADVGAPVIPDDPRFIDMWGLDNVGQAISLGNGLAVAGGTSGADIDASLAWSFGTGDTRMVVGVVDTGIDYTHPDLFLNIWINQNEIPTHIRQNLVDVDGDGLITFYDLNYADPVTGEKVNQGHGKAVDINGDGVIDGSDIIREEYHFHDNKFTGPNEPIETTYVGGWANGLDTDGNGYIDDLIGWNFAEGNNNPLDRNYHGTHVAGTIGAVGNNGIGVAGINWQVRMMALRVDFADDGYATQAKALRYAIDNGAQLSNHSWGAWFNLGGVAETLNSVFYDNGIDKLREAFEYAKAKGHLVIAAAGNGDAVPGSWDPGATDGKPDNIDNVSHYPASFQHRNIISVAALDRHDRLTSFSNYGPINVDLGAPGELIWSTTPTYQTSAMTAEGIALNYAPRNGTSMAAPHVAGVAALVWSHNPGWGYQQVIDQILGTVVPVADLDGKTVTGGRLNALGAVSPGPWIQNARPITSTGVVDPAAVQTPTALHGFRVTFNEAIQPSSFTRDDVTVTDPLGKPIAVMSVVPVSDGPDELAGRQFDVIVASFPLGVFGRDVRLVIGPDIADLRGVRMDQNHDGYTGKPDDQFVFDLHVKMATTADETLAIQDGMHWLGLQSVQETQLQPSLEPAATVPIDAQLAAAIAILLEEEKVDELLAPSTTTTLTATAPVATKPLASTATETSSAFTTPLAAPLNTSPSTTVVKASLRR